LATDTESIMSRWRIYFSHPLNVRGFNDVRETEIHSAEALLSEPSACEVEMTKVKLKLIKCDQN